MTLLWPGRVGINVFWPMGGPVRTGETYPNDPYSIAESGAWATHVTSGIMARDQAAGIDHYRIQVSPAPFMQAIESGNASQLAGYHAALDEVVDDCISAGLAVMYSPFLSAPNIEPTAILQGTGDAVYLRYRTWLAQVAQRYAHHGDLFAIGTMNEPPAPASFPADWAAVQVDLYQAVRAVAPAMAVALTSANYSSLHLLSGSDWDGSFNAANGLDIAPFDDNTLYEYHPFIPAILCLQGATYTSNYKYVSGMTYPPRAAQQAGVIASMTTAVNADGGLDAGQKAAMIAALTAEIGYFYSIPQDQAWLRSLLTNPVRWADAKGLPASRLYAGECGLVRIANTDESAARYMIDLAFEVARTGHRIAWDHLDTWDYGLTDGDGTAIGDYRPVLRTDVTFNAAAILARRSTLRWRAAMTNFAPEQVRGAILTDADGARLVDDDGLFLTEDFQ